MTNDAPRCSAELVDRVVPRVDGWRGPALHSTTDIATYKEWMHFCILLPGTVPGYVLVNLSVMSSASTGVPRWVSRLFALAEHRGFTGGIEDESVERPPSHSGKIDFRVGRNEVVYRSGAFRLSLDNEWLSGELSIVPVTLPTLPTNVSLGASRSLHWVVVPRLEASGWLAVGGKRLRLDRAPAYHDHNWGNFQWGTDLAWEWGFMLPDDPGCPHSLVVARVSDGARQRTLAQTVLVWKDESLVRTFQNREVRFSLEGNQTGAAPFTIPKIARLLLPEASASVPARCRVRASGPEADVAMDFDTSTLARLAVPSDTDDLRLLVLNEAHGTARVQGTIGGERIEFHGRGLMEFTRA